MREPLGETQETPDTDATPNSPIQDSIYEDLVNWRLAPEPGEIKTKPNVLRKLWKNITKNDLGEFNEENWLVKLGWIIDEMVNKKLIIIRLIFGDPLVTPLEKKFCRRC